MSDLEFSALNGYKCKDKKAREDIAQLELTKASNADLAEEVLALNTSISEVAGNLEDLETIVTNLPQSNNTAIGVSYSNVASGLAAETVQGAIDELAAREGGSGGGTAEETAYDNTASGLAAETVQGAIDELAANASLRYNAEEDAVEAFIDGEWTYWKRGGFANPYFVADGIYNSSYGFEAYTVTDGATNLMEVNQEDEVVIFKVDTSVAGSYSGFINTMFDFSNYTKLVLNIVGIHTNVSGCKVGVTSILGHAGTADSLAVESITGTGLIELDITSINEVGYIYLYLSASNSIVPFIRVTDFHIE